MVERPAVNRKARDRNPVSPQLRVAAIEDCVAPQTMPCWCDVRTAGLRYALLVERQSRYA